MADPTPEEKVWLADLEKAARDFETTKAGFEGRAPDEDAIKKCIKDFRELPAHNPLKKADIDAGIADLNTQNTVAQDKDHGLPALEKAARDFEATKAKYEGREVDENAIKKCIKGFLEFAGHNPLKKADIDAGISDLKKQNDIAQDKDHGLPALEAAARQLEKNTADLEGRDIDENAIRKCIKDFLEFPGHNPLIQKNIDDGIADLNKHNAEKEALEKIKKAAEEEAIAKALKQDGKILTENDKEIQDVGNKAAADYAKANKAAADGSLTTANVAGVVDGHKHRAMIWKQQAVDAYKAEAEQLVADLNGVAFPIARPTDDQKKQMDDLKPADVVITDDGATPPKITDVDIKHPEKFLEAEKALHQRAVDTKTYKDEAIELIRAADNNPAPAALTGPEKDQLQKLMDKVKNPDNLAKEKGDLHAKLEALHAYSKSHDDYANVVNKAFLADPVPKPTIDDFTPTVQSVAKDILDGKPVDAEAMAKNLDGQSGLLDRIGAATKDLLPVGTPIPAQVTAAEKAGHDQLVETHKKAKDANGQILVTEDDVKGIEGKAAAQKTLNASVKEYHDKLHQLFKEAGMFPDAADAAKLDAQVSNVSGSQKEIDDAKGKLDPKLDAWDKLDTAKRDFIKVTHDPKDDKGIEAAKDGVITEMAAVGDKLLNDKRTADDVTKEAEDLQKKCEALKHIRENAIALSPETDEAKKQAAGDKAVQDVLGKDGDHVKLDKLNNLLAKQEKAIDDKIAADPQYRGGAMLAEDSDFAKFDVKDFSEANIKKGIGKDGKPELDVGGFKNVFAISGKNDKGEDVVTIVATDRVSSQNGERPVAYAHTYTLEQYNKMKIVGSEIGSDGKRSHTEVALNESQLDPDKLNPGATINTRADKNTRLVGAAHLADSTNVTLNGKPPQEGAGLSKEHKGQVTYNINKTHMEAAMAKAEDAELAKLNDAKTAALDAGNMKEAQALDSAMTGIHNMQGSHRIGQETVAVNNADALLGLLKYQQQLHQNDKTPDASAAYASEALKLIMDPEKFNRDAGYKMAANVANHMNPMMGLTRGQYIHVANDMLAVPPAGLAGNNPAPVNGRS